MYHANAPIHFKVLTKFGLCSKCSQKLHEFSLPRAGKIFATAPMLGLSLKCAEFQYGTTFELRTLGTHARAMIASENWLTRFAEVLLKLRRAIILRERHPQRKKVIYKPKKTWRVLLLLFYFKSFSELYGLIG